MPKAHVIGLGRSGIAAARMLKAEGWEVTLSDRNTSDALKSRQQALALEGIAIKLGATLVLPPPDRPDLIVVSPGVPWDIPELVEARRLGIDTIGELELAWRYLKALPWVGITGTNGKTTTTALVAAIFQAAGLHAPACGNIGYAACELAWEYLQKGQKLDWVIAEASSYQIESSAQLSPEIGIWTTFTPDHLERHQTLERYFAIKNSLLMRSRQRIINGDDPYLRQQGGKTWVDAYWTSVKGRDYLPVAPEKGVYLEGGWVVAFADPILPITAFTMAGEHNQQNLLLAVAAARLAGIDKDAIAQAITHFPGVPHRLEHVCTLNGIRFINDSKATNYDAAQVGLASVDAPVVLIAGGQAKAGDDRHWIETIKAKAAAVLLIGQAASTLAQRLQASGYETYKIVETLEAAVPQAAALARQQNARVVLLSPACASFDQYSSFEERGDRFRQLCLQLI